MTGVSTFPLAVTPPEKCPSSQKRAVGSSSATTSGSLTALVAFYDSNFGFITKSPSRFRTQCGVKLDCDKPIEIIA